MTRAKSRGQRKGRATAPRNPFVQHLRRRGKGLEASAKAYRRRPKHRKARDEGGEA